MACTGEGPRGQDVEADDLIGLAVNYWLHLGRGQKLRIVGSSQARRAKKAEAKKLIAPHVEAAERHAQYGAKARPERLDVTNKFEVAINLRSAIGGFIF